MSLGFLKRSVPPVLPPPAKRTRTDNLYSPQYEGTLFPAPEETGGNICYISPRMILPNPSQPRKHFDDGETVRLADSIRQYGIIQPLSVRVAENGKYELIAGERRLRASKLLGLSRVPCIVMSVSRECSAELAVIENLQREDLNIFEQGYAIERLIKTYGYTQAKVAQKLSLSQSAVANKLRLLRFTQAEKTAILEYRFAERQARAFLRLPCETRGECIDYVYLHKMNAAQTEEYIDRLLMGKKPSPRERIPCAKPIKKGGKKFILKDLRMFYNSIDHAVRLIKDAGVTVETTQNESEEKVELLITIQK